MKKKLFAFALAGALSLGCLAGCGGARKNTVKLDPNNPVSLTVWHYYNGAQQAAFDTLVSDFNATVGKEGVELAFEAYLHGTDGTRIVSTNSEGKVTGVFYEKEPQPGSTVELTIDLKAPCPMPRQVP